MSELSLGTLSGLAANSYVIDVAAGSQLTQPGMVLQVVSTTKTDTFSTTSTSLTDITGLSASITPATTASQVLVTVSIPFGHSSSNNNVFTITDGSDTILVNPGSPGSRTASFMARGFTGVAGMGTVSFSFLHSPATASSFTYKIRCLTASGTLYVNRSDSDSDLSQFGRGIATITLMEVAG